MKEITHTHKYSAKLIFFKNGSRIERRIFYSFDEFYPLCFVCWSIEKSPGVRYELAQVPRTVHKIDWWITASRDRPSSYRILFALTIKGGQQSVWLLSLSLSLSHSIDANHLGGLFLWWTRRRTCTKQRQLKREKVNSHREFEIGRERKITCQRVAELDRSLMQTFNFELNVVVGSILHVPPPPLPSVWI
jgi:hypothetical protein